MAEDGSRVVRRSRKVKKGAGSLSADEAAAFIAGVVRRIRRLKRRDAASLRGIRREASRRVADLPPGAVLGLATGLLETREPGAHVVAYELVLHHATALARVRPADLRRLGAGMSSWGEVDAFACLVAGRAWREGQVPDSVVEGWADSGDRWWRRAALVSTVPLNVRSQGGQGDAARTLKLCGRLVRDRDDMVVKAMSWALRALAVRCPEAVAAFVDRHEADLAARVVREVRRKLSTGVK